MKSKYEADEIHIVSEVADGETVETRLPREQAQTLYRKIRAVNPTAWIQKETLIVDEPFISPFEVEA